MSSASGPDDERPLQRARLESDVAVPEQSAVAQTARLPVAPSWTLDTNVEVVLLRGAAPPADMKLSAFLSSIGRRIVPTEDVSMRFFLRRPHQYIPDEEQRNAVLNEVECLPYELFYKVAPFLGRKAISTLRQWAESGRGVRPSPSDNIRDDIWNVGIARLNAAVDSIKRDMPNEAALVQQVSLEERVETIVKEIQKLRTQTSTTSVNVIPGAFESVLNARWSHVLSGQVGMPLGMRVVDGPPEYVWPDAEVDTTQVLEPMEDVDEERGGGLELLVLTSAMGWPYTEFIHSSERDVFVRREVVRVWHVVRSQLARWPYDDSTFTPKPYVLVGTPGIGKSFGCGSYLLYELLHYDAVKVPTVAYFVRGSAYIFHKTGAMAGRVVLYEEAKSAVSAMRHMANERQEMLVRRKEAEGVKDAARKCKAKCGFIIFDVGTLYLPDDSLPTSEWGCVVLSSPSEKNFKSWMDSKGALRFYINCYTTREMKAFFAWQERCRCVTAEHYQASLAEIERQWRVVEKRIYKVGLLPRYVFDYEKYALRCKAISVALFNINDVDMARYMRILLSKIQWTEDSSTDEIIKLVRAASDPVEDCQNFPASEVIGAKLKTLVVNYFFRRSYLAKALEMPGVGADVLEKFGSCAFMYESVVDKVVEKMKCLPSALCSHMRDSVLSRLRAAARYAQYYQVIAFKIGDQRRGVSLEARDLRTGVLYIPDLVNFPVLDAFYFVDAPPQDAAAVGRAGARGACASWTIVCLQTTKKNNHDTTTGAVVGLMSRMREWIRDWDVVKEQLLWEMIYVQHRDAEAMSRRQVCAMAAGEVTEEHRDAHVFWNRVEQYQVQMDNNLLAAVMVAAGCEPCNAKLQADDVEEFI
ncbi:putative retrotransposon hot spot protein 4 (RHS4) [Trypanosoma vivax]|nr:putative retrotransposon hot spot protein 4 (RHS4) [Trypanosoma vivax]